MTPSYRKRIVDCASKGEPPMKQWGSIQTVKFVIYDFKNREEKKGIPIVSPALKAHGYEWRIHVYPKGDLTHGASISWFLYSTRDGVTASYSIRTRAWETKIQQYTFRKQKPQKGVHGWGLSEVELNSFLEEDGSLVTECDIQIAVPTKTGCIWYPKELQQQDILVALYQDASSETSDVVFSVENNEYRVHKSILSLRCKKLYEIANECDDHKPIPIHSTRGEIFKKILDFAYTVKTPEIENKDVAIELIVAADSYDCVQLKLYVESIVVDEILTAENAAELLIFADSHSCALLKEAATNLFVADATTVKKAEAWSRVKESNRLLAELVDSLTCPSNMEEYANSTNEIDCLDVTTLREELEKANLELDGSREVLVDRLKSYRQDGQDEDAKEKVVRKIRLHRQIAIYPSSDSD